MGFSWQQIQTNPHQAFHSLEPGSIHAISKMILFEAITGRIILLSTSAKSYNACEQSTTTAHDE